MKITLLSIFISFSLIAFSQFSIVERSSTEEYASDTLVLDISEANKEYADFGHISIYFDVANNGTETDLVITRKVIDVPSQWFDLLCWGTGCYSIPDQNEYTTPLDDAVNCKTDGTLYELKPQIKPNDVVGTGHYRYYLVDINDNNNHVDSVDLIFNFGILNTKILEKQTTFSVSPNPSSDYVFINLDNKKEMDFKVVDVLGNVVLTDVVFASKKIDVSQFKNGLYFITVFSKDRSMVSRKMIVKH